MTEAAKVERSSVPALEQWVAKVGARLMPMTESSRAEAMEILEAPGRPLSDLNPVATRDPMFAVALLRRVNGMRQASERDPVTTPEAAMNLLGRGQLQPLLASFAVVRDGDEAPARARDFVKIVQRSTLAADIAEYFARSRGNLNPAEIRAATLIRPLGELAIAWHANNIYRRLRVAGHKGLACSNALARQLLGFTESDLATALARRWMMPPTVTTALDASRYFEHRALAPMLADELTLHARDGWYEKPVTECMEMVAEYLGVSVGEASRQVHAVAVASARAAVNASPAAAALIHTGGRIPLPPDYKPFEGPSMRTEAKPTALPPRKAPPTSPPPVPRARTARPAGARAASVSPSPAGATAVKPGPSEPPVAPAPPARVAAPRAVPGEPVAAGPAAATANAPSPPPGTPAARTAGPKPPPQALAGTRDTTKAPPAAAGPAAAGDRSSPAGAARGRPPRPEVLDKAHERFRAMHSGTPAKPSEILQLLLRSLHLGIGLPRVVVLGMDRQASALVLRFQVGPVPGWPKGWSLSTLRPNLFERLILKPQRFQVPAALIGQRPQLFPPELMERIDSGGFWLASIHLNSRPWGLVYAETRPDLDPAVAFARFGTTCDMATKALAINAAR